MPNSGFNETANPTNGTRNRAEQAADSLLVRELTFADLPLVISIERRSFPSPWSVGMFSLEMSKPDTIALAAIEDGRVTGYIIVSRFDRAWHLMSIAVAPESRRRGMATRLIESALERIPGEPVTLEVRPSNRSAIELYEGFGFRSFGLRKGYYPDNGEDALIMWKGEPAAAGVPAGDLPARV